MNELPDFWRGSSRNNRSRGIMNLQNQIDQLFSQMLEPFDYERILPEKEASFRPSLDITDLGDHYLLSLDIPGVKTEDINVEVRGDQLLISGERKSAREEKNADTYRSERFHGAFFRSLSLPEGVKAEDIESDYKNGVLSIAVPKTGEATMSKKIKIGERKQGFFDQLLHRKSVSHESKSKEHKEQVA